MSSTASIRKGDVIRFIPEARTNRVTVLVDAVTTTPSLVMIHGVRCDASGIVDSQARSHAWAVRPDVDVDVVA